MVGRIYHVGLTVSDLDRSIAFYRDILGLEFQGEIFMEGEETDKMFRRANCKARVAYLNGSKAIEAPPVELIQFVDNKVNQMQSDLFTTSISEVCFYTDDIDSAYKILIENHVECLSEPQYFDFRADGFGESRAFYFRDPDGIILEMMQLKDMLKDNINSIYAMIDSLSEEELFKPHMRKWADEATKTAVWEVYKFIHVNTVAPFGTFRTKIRKWKKIAL